MKARYKELSFAKIRKEDESFGRFYFLYKQPFYEFTWNKLCALQYVNIAHDARL
jgi:hypothetical protein